MSVDCFLQFFFSMFVLFRYSFCVSVRVFFPFTLYFRIEFLWAFFLPIKTFFFCVCRRYKVQLDGRRRTNNEESFTICILTDQKSTFHTYEMSFFLVVESIGPFLGDFFFCGFYPKWIVILNIILKCTHTCWNIEIGRFFFFSLLSYLMIHMMTTNKIWDSERCHYAMKWHEN